MIFSLAIYSAPSSQSGDSAYRFAKSLLATGHQLYRVFFYYDGAYQGSSFNSPRQDEINLTEAWEALQQEHDIDISVCIAAGLKRGVIDTAEQERYSKSGANLSTSMTLGGLGDLVEASLASDRLITFGG